MPFETEREKVAHLLRRFGLGASEQELDYYSKDGLSAAITLLLDYDKVDEGFPIDLELFKNPANDLVPMPGVQAWWALRLLVTKRPLQEKMTLFWHDHFATNASKVTVPPMMYQQNETLRTNALGSFETLLLEVSRDPAMIFWLDNQFNVKGKPNENFAREVMELFTLGIGNYTEQDVQEAARAFTGWTYRRLGPLQKDKKKSLDFLFRPFQHDNESKTVLGKTGNLGGEEVISILCEKPQTARYITTKIWEWFAYRDPEPALIEKLSDKFMKGGLHIKTLLRAIMESPEFYSAKAFRGIYKSPADFVIPTARQLGVGAMLMAQLERQPDSVAPARGYMAALVQGMKGMGMDLLFPPDVSGWEGGQGWISSATMVERIQWGERLFGQAAQEGRRAQIRFASMPLFAKDPTPRGVVTTLVSIFDAPIPEKRLTPMVQAAENVCGNRVTAANANQTASAVARLIFGTPEFQMN